MLSGAKAPVSQPMTADQLLQATRSRVEPEPESKLNAATPITSPTNPSKAPRRVSVAVATTAERQQQAEDDFLNFDADGSGTIDEEELSPLFEKLIGKISARPPQA